MDNKQWEDYSKEIKLSVGNKLHSINVEENLLDGLKVLTQRSEKTISDCHRDIKDLVIKVFKGTVAPESPLGIFLSKKPAMPHEYHENYLAALARIIADLLQDDYGRTNQAGTDDFALGPNSTKKLWEDIEKDFTKILQDFFGITPFFDTSRWDSIGFFVNSKWLSPEEPVK